MKRSKFSLSNYKLATCDMGQLVPIGLCEVLPGDTIQQSTSLLLRVSPLVNPVMHPVVVRIHHWFVPHRLVWSESPHNWENFITGGTDGLDDSTFPTITFAGAVAVKSLADYLGVPTGVAGLVVSALPFRGYQLIFKEWYRDQDLVAAPSIDLTDGADVTTSTDLQSVAWEKDYFTSARPWTQKGPAVTLPLGTSAKVAFSGDPVDGHDYGIYSQNKSAWRKMLANDTFVKQSDTAQTDVDAQLFADLSTATAASINELREAMALQRYQEARARYGSRYTEYLKYLGISPSDARLQRPEYLGGGKATISFSEILQTGPTTSGTAKTGVGLMAGHGLSTMRSNRYRRFFEEHGYIFSLLSVRPKTIYAQGVDRTWLRRTKEDFFQKELQHIGQQEIQRQEVYAGAADPDNTFGFQDRYDDYRRMESHISGEFRSTLDTWHYARIFAAEPSLNSDFVTAVPTKRVNQDTTNNTLWVMANHSIQARRMLSPVGSSFIY